jgi:hypothetical protein
MWFLFTYATTLSRPWIPSTFELLLIAELFAPNNGRAQFIYCLLLVLRLLPLAWTFIRTWSKLKLPCLFYLVLCFNFVAVKTHRKWHKAREPLTIYIKKLLNQDLKVSFRSIKY